MPAAYRVEGVGTCHQSRMWPSDSNPRKDKRMSCLKTGRKDIFGHVEGLGLLQSPWGRASGQMRAKGVNEIGKPERGSSRCVCLQGLDQGMMGSKLSIYRAVSSLRSILGRHVAPK